MGMSYLHDMGVVHRDLACRNILLSESMTAKIADFGFSVQLSANSFEKIHRFKVSGYL